MNCISENSPWSSSCVRRRWFEVSPDLALLLLGVVLGVYLFGHGSQKLCGWSGGRGFRATVAGFASRGFRPAGFWTALAAVAETLGGFCLFLGLFGQLAGLAIAAPMVIATVVVHWPKGAWSAQGGFELPLVNLAGALAITLLGS